MRERGDRDREATLDERAPEPEELMDDIAQARAYAAADFSNVNQGFVDRFREAFPACTLVSERHWLVMGRAR